MGGVGSGRWPGLRKGLVGDHLDLDVLELHRERRLEPGEWYYRTWWRGDRALLTVMIQALDDGVELSYPPRTRGRGRGVRQTRYDVPLAWTACNFGGERPWFECPGEADGVACGRRAAKLYYRDGLFLCRLCQDLSYASQGRVLRTGPLRKAQGIRLRLGGSLDIRDPFPPRPKGMHRATHARLHDEYLDALEEHLGVTAVHLGRVDGTLVGLLGGLFPDR
jgi:hypothetical protein